MSLTVLTVLFLVLEVATPLTVEGIKNTCDGLEIKYNSTAIALITAIVLSLAVSNGYMLIKGISYDTQTIVYMIALVVLNWLGATLGYDKVKAILTSLKSDEE